MNNSISDIAPGAINSELGAELATALRKSALIEVANWCRQASAILCDHGDSDAEKSDMVLFLDASTLLNAIADKAA